jgi:ribose transport system permease protein
MRMIRKKLLEWSAFPSLVLLVLFACINTALMPNFMNSSSLAGFLASNSPLICVAIAAAVVLIGGGIDISLGAVVSLVNVVMITMIGRGWGPGSATLFALGVALAFGILNGVVVSFLRVTPLLATFATSSVAAGLALWIMPAPGGSVPVSFVDWYNGFFLGLPVSLYFILLLFVIWIGIRFTPLGTWLYAVGKEERKAFISAVPVSWVQFFTYVFAALTAGIGGIALTGSIGSGDALAGLPLSLNAIAACVIGGVSLMGGSGEVIGSIFGAVVLGMVTTTVLVVHIAPFYQDFISGLILLVGVLGVTLLRRKWASVS